jgi:hypothetical protein
MKKNTEITWPPLFALLGIFVTAPTTVTADESLQNPALKRLYSELQTLFRKHYPTATSHLLKDKIHFEHATRVFIVHEPAMTGEWQDPWETRGPRPGGILCDLTFQKGPYQGQAVVPHFRQALLQDFADRTIFSEARRTFGGPSLLSSKRERRLSEGVHQDGQ